MNTQTIGWIGVGKMGLPMIAHLRKAGYCVYVNDVNSENLKSAIDLGCISSDSVANLCEHVSVIFSMIPDDSVLQSLAIELASNLPAGAVYTDLSTVSPAASAKVSSLLADAKIDYLRAPVSGSTVTAQSASLTIMLSGNKKTYKLIEPLLATFSSQIFYLGDSEEARYLKLVLNLLVGATSSLVAEALALGTKGGIDRSLLMDVICASAVSSPLLKYKYHNIADNKYSPAFSLAQMMKDFDLLLQTGRTDHVPLPLASVIRQQFETSFIQGQGEEDFFVLCREQTANS